MTDGVLELSMNQSSAVTKKRQKQINAIVIATSLFFLSVTSFSEQRMFTTIALSSLIHINPQELFALITIVIVANWNHGDGKETYEKYKSIDKRVRSLEKHSPYEKDDLRVALHGLVDMMDKKGVRGMLHDVSLNFTQSLNQG